MAMTDKAMLYVVAGLGVAVVSAVSGCADVLNAIGGPKVVEVDVKAGHVTITDREDKGLSHVKVECNNGLIIDADWQRNPSSDFGYDIFEPDVNQTYNRLVVMMTARTVIASYLKGNYDD
jgi:hypothetical protein